MTWEEKRQAHIDAWQEHYRKGSAALKAIVEDTHHPQWDELWEESKREFKEAHKHWGIAQAMWTRRYGRA